jgi:hypothetical protein
VRAALKYDLKAQEDSVKVTFIRNMGRAEVISTVLLFRFGTWTWTYLKRTLYSTGPDSWRDYANMFRWELCGFATIIMLRIVIGLMLRTQAVFAPQGILVRKTFFGLPLRQQWYPEDEVHRFGINHQGHAAISYFGFAASGSTVALSGAATPAEIVELVRQLQESGIVYNVTASPKHRVSPANSFLRL